MLNQCQFIGHLGGDPEVRQTTGGQTSASFSLAATERWKDRQTGEDKSRTEWVRVKAWDGLAGIAQRHLRKGSLVYIQGRMQTRKWQDQSGQDRWTTEVVLAGPAAVIRMLGGKQGATEPVQTTAAPGAQTQAAAAAIDDELPF